MTQPPAKPVRHRAPAADGDESRSSERWRSVLLGGLVAIYVARPLLPCEAPATVAGDGLPFAMLTLLLAAGWSLARQTTCDSGIRFGVVEAAWAALLVCQAASAILATRDGAARAAINTFWEWAGLGIGFLLLRQLLRGDREKRAVIVVMIGLALVLSLDGIHQYFVDMPAVREFYRLHAEESLREIGIQAPPGSAARKLFEERLKSTEPTATFALANSLAGFLTPWLLMILAVGWLGQGSAIGWRHRAAAAAAALPLGLCLLLTKSRAAWLALLLAFAALLWLWRQNRRRTWRIAVGAALAACLLAAAALAVGALDRQVITQALTSLSYRGHYWQGALGIIREHPWFGCGPGNFQDEYTRYKLPQASEVVADPHNFLFEVWATAGTPALLALLALLGGAASQWRRALGSSDTPWRRRRSPSGDRHSRHGVSGLLWPQDGSIVAPLAGGLGGFLLAFAVGPLATVGLPWGVLFTGLIVLPLTAAAFAPWIETGEIPRHAPFVCGLALAINMLAAGGIGFAGVAGSLWLLLAIGARDAEDHRRQTLPRWIGAGLCAAWVVLLATCWLTAYRPVLKCRSLLAEADRDPAGARRHLLAAAKADPRADEPWRRLADLDFARRQRQATAGRSARWEQDQRELLRRRPHSSAVWREAGGRYYAAYCASPDDQQYLSAATEHFRRAAELYPNDPLAHAVLARALDAGHQPQAVDEAAEALRLHQQTPHQDQKLPPELLSRIKWIARTEN